MEFNTRQELFAFIKREFPEIMILGVNMKNAKKVLAKHGWIIIKRAYIYIIDSLDPALYPQPEVAKKKINKIWHLVLASFLAISILLATCLCPMLYRYAAALVALAAIIIIWGISSIAEK